MDLFCFLFIIGIYYVLVVVAQQKRGFLGAETSSVSLGSLQQGEESSKQFLRGQRVDDGRILTEISGSSSSSVYMMFLL